LQLGSFAQRPDCPEGLIAWLALQPVRRSAATTTKMQNRTGASRLIGAGQWDVVDAEGKSAMTRFVAGGGDLTEQRTLNLNSTRRSEYEAAGNADHRRERRDAARFWGELPLDPPHVSGTPGVIETLLGPRGRQLTRASFCNERSSWSGFLPNSCGQ
jgi:hypothetical protein